MSTMPSPVVWQQNPPGAHTLDIVCLGFSAPVSCVHDWDPSHALAVIANPTTGAWAKSLTQIANTYDNCRIYAWSLGVITASRLLGDISNADIMVTNGVIHPFEGCLDRTQAESMATDLTPAQLRTFQMGMCGSKTALGNWLALDGHPNRDHAQAALAFWINLCTQPVQIRPEQVKEVVVGTHDRIMNPDAQIAQWATFGVHDVHTLTKAHWIPERLSSAKD